MRFQIVIPFLKILPNPKNNKILRTNQTVGRRTHNATRAHARYCTPTNIYVPNKLVRNHADLKEGYK